MGRREAEINWDWLETKAGLKFLKRLNHRIKEIPDGYKILCSSIDCPFNFRCENNCDKAFSLFPYSGACPCFNYKSPVDLAIILSDYYDMIKNEKI